ncbi:MAG: hypothetical protein LBL48_01530 [Azoarcus sp.]|nr:hypothetical protein [Azoarcus sp.]
MNDPIAQADADKQAENAVSKQCDKPRPRKGIRWLKVLLIAVAIPVVYVIWKVSVFVIGFQPSEMAMAQYTPKDVIGDLGGMKVRIPRHYAEYVEYDGDPGFGEKRKGPRPEHTFDSRLRSFGIEARFPDMKGLENAQLREENRRQPLQEKMWIRISITAGESYPGDGFLDRRTNSTLFNIYSPKSIGHWNYTYERMPEDEYGLEVWRLSSIDPRTGKPARESDDTEDIYIHRESSGNVDAHIRCGRPRTPKGIGRCRIETSLAPKAQAVVDIAFRRGLLPEWKQIQQSARNLLLSFEVDPSSSSDTSLTLPSPVQTSR